MPYINSKYDCLSLSDEYLKDPLLLALAWKKSHEYIRSINWYADNFELDKSALNLADLCNKWSDEMGGVVSFSPLKLVPAPSSLKDDDDTKSEEARLLYVAMTRAQEYLLLTASNNNHYTQRFAEIK